VNKWDQGQFETHIDGVISLAKTFISIEGENSGSKFLEGLY
jgi:hypothetical protein